MKNKTRDNVIQVNSETATEPAALLSRVSETAPIPWKTIQFLQQQEFKELVASEKAKLKTSITLNQFIQPFYVWLSPDNVIYGLDGFHRSVALKELELEGIEIPELLPATFIYCKDKQDAAKLVLLYSSQYAHITKSGLQEFMDLFSLNQEEMSMTVDIPGLDLGIEIPATADPFNDEGVGVKNQYGVIVMCDSEQSQEKVFNALTEQGHNCKIVVT